MAIDMELNDNPRRQLTDQEKEFYELLLFIVNQGFQRLLLWLKSRIMLVLALTFKFPDYAIFVLAVLSTLFRIFLNEKLGKWLA